MNLNDRSYRLCESLVAQASALRVVVSRDESGARLIDCGAVAEGGLEAGRLLARICLADLASVDLIPGDARIWPGPAVAVATDHPVAACLGAQYAGWQISGERFFAMGSGPMRAAAGREELILHLGFTENSSVAVGVLESAKLPPTEVCQRLASACRVAPENLTLLVARTASQAGTFQVVARSVETALHKMHELGFDLSGIVSGHGVAPLPPVAGNDLAAMGRTNDAVLYGGEVTLWLRGDDAQIEKLGPLIPSCSSRDFGKPFGAIFQQYDRDFYKIDPHLFSPAVISLNNLNSGRTFRYGQTRPDVLRASFEG